MSGQVTGLEPFEKVKRLIVVAAHPDDLECCCSGTLLQLIARGVEVFSVNCTLGDIGDSEGRSLRPALAITRLRETEEAARLLGLAETFNLGHHDGELVPNLELRAQLARLYRLTQADTLFTFDPFWTGQIHPDHRAAGQAALDAYMPSKMPLYRPEQLRESGAAPGKLERVFLFSTDRDPNVNVDVSSVYEQKLAACMAHVSQFPKGEESLKWLKELDGRAGAEVGVPYAERFRQIDVW
ncbi:MAG: PIG-L family deacetylase [Caldilineaceae bacterium]|nr:PIG-L family deacetylase [Caldilineaceae bacterium]